MRSPARPERRAEGFRSGPREGGAPEAALKV